MTSRVHCVDCEWQGKQSQVNMKWGVRRCPKCNSLRLVTHTVTEPAQEIDYALMARLAGDLGSTDL